MEEEASDEEYNNIPTEYYRRDNLESELEPEEEDLGYHSGATSTRFLSDNEDEEDITNNELQPPLVPSTPASTSRKLPRKPDPASSSRQSTAPRASRQPPDNRLLEDQVTTRRDSSKELLEDFTHDEPFQQQSSGPSSDTLLSEIAAKGYSKSVLWNLVRQGNNTLASVIVPEVNASGLLFTDLLPDTKTKGVRKNAISAKSFKVTLSNIKNVPIPNIPGLEVVTRRLRVCLFDPTSTKQYIGNVFTINAILNKDNTWIFPSERGVIVKRKQENVFLVRTTHSGLNLYILFEVCVVVKRNVEGKQETAEICCASVKLPFYSNPKTKYTEMAAYTLSLQPPGSTQSREGTSSSNRPSSANSLFRNNTGPTISFQLSAVSQTSEEAEQSNLPSHILTSLSMVSLLSVFRDVMADTLLTPLDKSSQGRISGRASDGVLSGFISIINSPDVLELFKGVWFYKKKGFKREEKANREFIKQQFIRSVLEIAPVLKLHNLPAEKQENRFRILEDFCATTKWQDKLLSSSYHFVPFSVSELILDVPLPSPLP